MKVIFVGLDGAGKTTLMDALGGCARDAEPTESPSAHSRSRPRRGRESPRRPKSRSDYDEFTVARVNMRAYDLGGRKDLRSMWQDYTVGAGAVVFVVDATDTERLSEARLHLNVRLRPLAGPSALFFWSPLCTLGPHRPRYVHFCTSAFLPPRSSGVSRSWSWGTSATWRTPFRSPSSARL